MITEDVDQYECETCDAKFKVISTMGEPERCPYCGSDAIYTMNELEMDEEDYE